MVTGTGISLLYTDPRGSNFAIFCFIVTLRVVITSWDLCFDKRETFANRRFYPSSSDKVSFSLISKILMKISKKYHIPKYGHPEAPARRRDEE